jgi:saccharopine dehydrogenase (NAD+, L-lysine-forming)
VSTNRPYPSVKPYPNEPALISAIKAKLDKAVSKAGRMPELMVMGALGRCGSGAADCAKKCGIPESNIIGWDLKETQGNPGPYPEILKHDIFVNSIYLSSPIPPFITKEMLGVFERFNSSYISR